MDKAPAWEHREVRTHLEESTSTLHSDYLNEPLNVAEALDRRRAGEPLEYILKHAHIGELTIKTDARALIPRPETETLIRRFTKFVTSLPTGPLVDCGTGTGFMAGWLSEHTTRSILATDRDRDALSLALENRVLHGWRYLLVQADRLRPFRKGSVAGIVANLPYVTPGDPELETSVVDYEPAPALFSETGPMSFYREFLSQSAKVLKSSGIVWMELTPDLVQKLRSWAGEQPPWSSVRREKDLSQRWRYLVLTRDKRGA